MSFTLEHPSEACPICGEAARIQSVGWGNLFNCTRCGGFVVPGNVVDAFKSEYGNPINDELLRALASHLVRKMQIPGKYPAITEEFIRSLKSRSLPTPAELMDNFVIWVANKANGRPGQKVPFNNLEPSMSALVSEIGGETNEDIYWTVDNLSSAGMIERFYQIDDKKLPNVTVTSTAASGGCNLSLTVSGWQRFEQLKNESKTSKYAFFARKFDNSELDKVFENCLCPAVRATGFELRTVTQKAGTITAIIEDEIRRCRFLISDLSDDNNGSYWEAGFAEGLGKPVIYICRDKIQGSDEEKKTHFDTNQRRTVRWSLNSLDRTQEELKAVIRNTLLGDAKQSDD